MPSRYRKRILSDSCLFPWSRVKIFMISCPDSKLAAAETMMRMLIICISVYNDLFWANQLFGGIAMGSSTGTVHSWGMSVHDLTTAENLVLCTFRFWALTHAANYGGAVPDWRGGLRASGLSRVAETLCDPLLRTIFTGARSGLEMQHAGCRGISRGEWPRSRIPIS